jgi:hypothetical protein
MQKAVSVILAIIFMQGILLAYDEPGMLNIKTPTGFKQGQMEVKIQHRFYGKINQKPLDNFFGLDIGANIGLGIRYVVLPKLEINSSYTRDGKEYTIGASYTYFPSIIPIKSQIDVQFFSYKEYDIKTESEERKNNVFGLLSLQTTPILKRIIPTVNAGYDGDAKKLGAGLGLYVIALNNLGIVQKIILLGEYFPTKESGYKNCYDFGFRIETYGHHFDFLLGNNSAIGLRHLMLGTKSDRGLYFGFNIKRLIGS